MTMLIELPEHVAAKATGLGEPLARFDTSQLQSTLCLVLSGPITLLGLGACVGSIVLAAEFDLGDFAAGKIFMISLFGSFAVLKLVWTGWKLRGSGVFVFAKGFVRYRRAACEVMLWERVHLVRRGMSPGSQELTIITPSRVALTDAEGCEWVFTEALSGLKEFRALAEERTLPHMLPVALDLLLGGRTLMFGDIGATEEGLTYPHRALLPWNLIAQIGVEGGRVQVVSTLMKKPHCLVEVNEVPNAHLLLALADQFRRG